MMISLRIRSVHKFSLIKSRTRNLLTTGNSPLSTRRTYKFDVNGSKHSLLPKICDVEAVGIGASKSELRMPCFCIRAFSFCQSQRPLFGSSPHMSNCKIPYEAGLPTKFLYGPSTIAKSTDDYNAA